LAYFGEKYAVGRLAIASVILNHPCPLASTTFFPQPDADCVPLLTSRLTSLRDPGRQKSVKKNEPWQIVIRQ
jgi:hypothetical protein